MTIYQAFSDLELESVWKAGVLEGYCEDTHIGAQAWGSFKQKLYSVKDIIQKCYTQKYDILKQCLYSVFLQFPFKIV